MHDPTENDRRRMCKEINSNAKDRKWLEAEYGQVWDTEELQRDFAVMSFMAPYVIVYRKADHARGTLTFQHHPRYYYDFQKV